MNLFESEEIESIQGMLNSEESVPCMGFRRNVAVYELVCYVNNITGCYLSKNSQPIPIFIGRCRTYFERCPPKAEEIGYFQLVNKYIDLMEKHLKENGVDTRYL